MQRAFDILFSSLAIIALAPLLLPVVIILRFTGEGEVFYVQKRVGLRGVQFGMFKFASLLKGSPSMGAGEITIRNDPRILPFGRILRKLKINELPQLLNVLKGDISIVGPLPMVPSTFEHYDSDAQKALCTIRPGLTGVGSVFFRDEERFLANGNSIEFYRKVIIPYKTELELWYLDRSSLYLYFSLIFLTAWVVVFPKSDMLESVFSDLPEPPQELTKEYGAGEEPKPAVASPLLGAARHLKTVANGTFGRVARRSPRGPVMGPNGNGNGNGKGSGSRRRKGARVPGRS
jgi:lipopolysaccharide/colanic/teichoic acid biosynthesis glycosyltransferase